MYIESTLRFIEIATSAYTARQFCADDMIHLYSYTWGGEYASSPEVHHRFKMLICCGYFAI